MKFTYFFQDMVGRIIDLNMYPFFDLAHVIMCAVTVREDINKENRLFRFKHPLSCWVSTILVTFAGSMVTNGLCGECILTPLANNKLILMTTVVWYLVFYSPFDIGYKMSNFLPVRFVFTAMKEIRRAGNIYRGILQANKFFPDAHFIIIIIGTVKGNGAGFMKPVEKLSRGIWNPTTSEFLRPSMTSKTGLMAAILFMLEIKTDLIPVPQPLLHFGIIIVFVYIKFFSLIMTMEDAFRPLENSISALIFGYPVEVQSHQTEPSIKEDDELRDKKTD